MCCCARCVLDAWMYLRAVLLGVPAYRIAWMYQHTVVSCRHCFISSPAAPPPFPAPSDLVCFFFFFCCCCCCYCVCCSLPLCLV
jgi:hypothetical protein